MNAAIINKIINLQEIVKNVIRSNQLYKTMGFLEINDLHSCILYAEDIYAKLKAVHANAVAVGANAVAVGANAVAVGANATDADNQQLITTLQAIVNTISTLISLYGCDTIDSLVNVCIGKYNISEEYAHKYNLLNSYVKPMRYRTIDWKKTKKVNPADEAIIKTADNFECFDSDTNIINFQNRVYGIKIAIHNVEKKNTIIVYGMIEDCMLEFIDDKMISDKIQWLNENKPSLDMYGDISYQRFIKCLTLKDLLIYSAASLKNNYITFIDTYVNNIAKKELGQVINEFIAQDLFDKRNYLIILLVNSGEIECHYMAYLLYDLLSSDVRGMIDTFEQTTIYDSLPCNVKKFFRDAMKHIINYNNKLTKIDITKISLEQRIGLMKTSDSVKEKAMLKLKEIKLKAEDSGSKAMQYLDGLLKIPFGIYKEEQILKASPDMNKQFALLVDTISKSDFYIKSQPSSPLPFPLKPNYTAIETYKYLSLLKRFYLLDRFKIAAATTMSKKTLINICDDVKKKQLNVIELGTSIKELRTNVLTMIEELAKVNMALVNEIIYKYVDVNINASIVAIESKMSIIRDFMKTMEKTLDDSVYGHVKAKRQIERIIGQWISGDSTGYCFGFEGPPGVGKTSLAKKGIAHCLKDADGVERPFAFIAMGGSTNSSTLDGHNYTYVGSTWGRIVDILMDTKIMNPIIFIDELDKVSKTEHGKEIIGILTHLIDQTQNDTFHDKYFNGIDLNLSKALFIFSYNDAELIDRILLDRIHRIKFDHLSVADKLIIMRNFILPEVCKKMGLLGMLDMSDETIEYIIENYTAEPGVRKLKEIMFEIVGEINLSVLKSDAINITIPICITIDDIKQKYLKERHELKAMKIHQVSMVGIINGLWANSLGKGGVLPIEATFFPSGTFLDLKLTGMQGDVMKESMTVAKSVAWSLFSRDHPSKKKALQKKMEEGKNQGIHIHVPEGATPKDGPSAGAAITMVLYSLFTEQTINREVAMTGEICLQGRITAIGGLDLKILGGIRAGVKTFIFPEENQKDFTVFVEKYGTKKDIKFISVSKIEELSPLIFV
jgi:ATP-dependent Lon protease